MSRKHAERVLALIAALSVTLALILLPALMPAGALAATQTQSKVFLGYWAYWGGSDRPFSSLDDNYDSIDLFSPYWYTLLADGSLKSREANHASMTETAHARGQKVIPLINKVSDNTTLVNATVRQRAVTNIYNLLVDKGYDGVNIDFEGMPPSTKPGVTAFMRELEAKLRPAGLLVTMAVPAKWSADDSRNSFAACFDYPALGKIVDYLVIMTYDHHAAWSGPGPVAEAGWVEEVIKYATGVVPAEKILLGLAGYGYDWSSRGCASLGAWEAPALAERHGVQVQWDSAAKVPHFTYWSSGIRHDVWYEDSHSNDIKIAMINKYNLGGAALWSLGQEDSRFWQVLNGTVGTSGGLRGTGSSGGGSPPGEDGGSTGGGGDGTVSPTGGSGTTGSGTEPGGGGTVPGGGGAGSPQVTFRDIPFGHWAYQPIAGLAAAGVVNGDAGGYFRPDDPVKRAEFAAMLSRALGLPEPPDGRAPAFRDVDPADWFYEAVTRVAAWGYMVGVDDGLFGPELHLTRQQAAVVAARVAGLVPQSGPALPFRDAYTVDIWALPAVRAAVSEGLIGGYPDGTFKPAQALSRAEAAVLIGRVRQ